MCRSRRSKVVIVVRWLQPPTNEKRKRCLWGGRRRSMHPYSHCTKDSCRLPFFGSAYGSPHTGIFARQKSTDSVRLLLYRWRHQKSSPLFRVRMCLSSRILHVCSKRYRGSRPMLIALDSLASKNTFCSGPFSSRLRLNQFALYTQGLGLTRFNIDNNNYKGCHIGVSW
jgi:hypothetical protein